MTAPFRLAKPSADSDLRLVINSENQPVTSHLPAHVAERVLEVLNEEATETLFYLRLQRQREPDGTLKVPVVSYMRAFGKPWNRAEIELGMAQVLSVIAQTLVAAGLAHAVEVSETPVRAAPDEADPATVPLPKPGPDVDEMYR